MPKKSKLTKRKKSSPSRRPPKQTRSDSQRQMVAERADGWRSLLSGLGTNRDKRTATTFCAEPTNWVENLELWRGDDLAGAIVEAIPDDMTREGWELAVEGDDAKDVQKEVMGFLEDLGVNEKFHHALCTERALGGAGMLIGANDLEDFSKPLDVSRVNEFTFLEVFEPVELTVHRWQNDPSKRGFGLPVMYRLNPMSPGGAKSSGVMIHESRLIIFPGIKVSRRQVTSQKGWGDAVLSRCREVLRDFQTSWAAAGLLVADFAQAVWKIKGLAEMVALDKNKELSNRISAMDFARSIVRATVIDADGEDFDRKQTPVNGLPDLLDRFGSRLAAAARTPVTRLMGISPAGLNATGDSDLRNYYDYCKSQQIRKMRPGLEKACRVAMSALEIEEPEDWSIQFKPLWQPTELEQAQARFQQMQTDTGYIEHEVLSPEVVREQRFSGREYSFATHIDPDTYVQPDPQNPTDQGQATPPDDPDFDTTEEAPDDAAIVSKTQSSPNDADQGSPEQTSPHASGDD